jgi:DNA-binding CsgD family transcriptional regulator
MALESLVYSIHAANDRDADWTEVLEFLRSWLQARLITLGHHHFAVGKGATLYDAPHDPAFCAAYADYAPRNPWFLSSVDYTAGRVMSGDELISNRELIRTDFYRGLLKPYGLFHRLCGVIARRGDLVYYVDAHRGEDQEEFGDWEKSNLGQALRHIALALENRWRYLQANDLANALMRVVDQNAHATLLAMSDGRVLYRNDRASEMSAHSTGLHIENDRLQAATPGESRSLHRAIEEVARSATAADGAISRVVKIVAPGAHSPAVLTVRAAGRTFLAEAGEFRDLAILTIRNSHSEHDPLTCPFARQFELTPAQARVNALVFTGHALVGVAQVLHVSENTVRSHLKQIFQKTNTHGQMELVHLHAQVCDEHG